ncbi:MAG: hypothetical protein LBP62_00830 [Clostridiales bacterium]|nr:hypothetical protein [Clostridiales bacterium]
MVNIKPTLRPTPYIPSHGGELRIIRKVPLKCVVFVSCRHWRKKGK